MRTVELICMANFYKHRGRCIVGLRANTFRWVRLVNPAHITGALESPRYNEGQNDEPLPLDLVRVQLARPLPDPHQPENWALGQEHLELLCRPAPGHLLQKLFGLQPENSTLLGNYGDRVSYSRFARESGGASLALVAPEHPRWKIVENGKRRPQLWLQFQWRGAAYELFVADPRWRNYLLDNYPLGVYRIRGRGAYFFSRLLLAVSLGDPLHGYCHKSVSGVLWVPSFQESAGPGKQNFFVERLVGLEG